MSCTVGRPKRSSTNSRRIERLRARAASPISARRSRPQACDDPLAPRRRPPDARPRRRAGSAPSRMRRKPAACSNARGAEARHLRAAPRGCGTRRSRRGARRSPRRATCPRPETRASSGAEAVLRSTPTALTASSTTASSDLRAAALVDVVLVLADADRLRLDLHQLGERVLQAPRDRRPRRAGTRRARATPSPRAPRPNRPRRRPR